MIKVKAFVQLKSDLYGRCVMIYKFGKFPHKMNHLLKY